MAAIKYLPAEYYTRFLSAAAKELKPGPIRGLFPLEKIPGVISLLAGKPNATTFPLTSIQFTTRSPNWDATQQQTLTIDGKLLGQSLQYSDTAGLPQMLDWVWGIQEFSHGRKKNEGWRSSIGSGSQDLIFKAFLQLLSPGDPILVESPVYAGVIPILQLLKCEMIEIETDSEGLKSSSLRSVLENWPTGKPKPKFLYTVPYGCNPTGMTASHERKLEMLQLAREHDLMILEDDPYFYLYYGDKPRPPSYFSLELQMPEVGRVLRFDSLSKVLSSGMRIGFASGPETLLKAIDLLTTSANLQVSSLTQTITFTLLNSWGYEGFRTHTQKVSDFYREKRDVFERAMKKNLDGLAEWNTPEAGLFFWFKLLLNSADGSDGDSADLIRTKALEKGVLALPGTAFLPNGRKSAYCRASFSLVPEEEVDEALKRLRSVLIQERSEHA